MITSRPDGRGRLRVAWTSLACGLAGAVFGAWAALASWEEDLTAEIQDLHNCDVAFLSQVVEREVRGERLVMAKVHCLDGRTFDAVRISDYDLFEFRECTVGEKQSC